MFSERLSTFIEYTGKSVYAFEMSIGVSKGAVYKPISNGKTVGVEVMEKIISIYPDLNIDWLVTGRGMMLKNSTIPGEEEKDVQVTSTGNSTGNSKSENLGVQNQANDTKVQYQRIGAMGQSQSQSIKIPILDTKAAASGVGYLPQGYIEEKDYVTFPSTLLKRGHQHIALQVKGDSMHPTLFDGDYIIACLLHSAEYPYMKNGKVFAIVSAERGVTIKRIHNHLVNFQFIRCNSDNRLHPTFDIQFQDITQIYEVVAKLSFNLPDESHNAYNNYISLEERLIALENRLQNIESHGAVESH